MEKWKRSLRKLGAKGECQKAVALVAFLSAMLEGSLGNSFQRRLAFYILGMLLQHDMPQISVSVREAMERAARSEESNQLRNQFEELLARM